MAEHSELVGEISSIEKMTTQERLKHAKKRRNTQLKKWTQYEKQLDKEINKKKKSNKKVKKTNNNARRVIFVNNVMLLEAAARNDVDEGELASLLACGFVCLLVCVCDSFVWSLFLLLMILPVNNVPIQNSAGFIHTRLWCVTTV